MIRELFANYVSGNINSMRYRPTHCVTQLILPMVKSRIGPCIATNLRYSAVYTGPWQSGVNGIAKVPKRSGKCTCRQQDSNPGQDKTVTESVLGAICGSTRSMDRAAQSMDP